MLSTISKENRDFENDIQDEIFGLINKGEHIMFNAGAGAGKTYALVKGLKFIVKNYGIDLRKHNQKVICITYTNVATKQIREQVGNSSLVEISTIHERVWDLIKDHQEELVKIHKEKLEKEINTIQNNLSQKSKFAKYQSLSEEQKTAFIQIMLSKKELFYKNSDEGAKEVRELFKVFLCDFDNLLNNISGFKSLVNTLFQEGNYRDCLENIDKRVSGFRSVKYNVKYNLDRLHWMRISHDTLLEYGIELIKRYPLLQQIIVDKYPYFLLDEYQDTDSQVIEAISLLSEYSKRINHPFVVGYFGDSAQNIYGNGVGKEINNIHSGIERVDKNFNRRSTKEVIDVINRIRNDDINQISIYSDCEGGSVGFYAGLKTDVSSFIDLYVKKWNISLDNKIHCFILTNKSVAEYSGFGDIYSFFSKTKKYRNGYRQLSTEVLSDQLSNLGEIPAVLIRLLGFRSKLLNEETLVHDIIDREVSKDMNITSLRNLIISLKNHESDSLSGFIDSMMLSYNNSSDENYKLLISSLFDFEGFPMKSLSSYITESLYPNAKLDKYEDYETSVTDFLNLSINVFDLWYKHLVQDVKGKIAYHTYHSTKGLEYDNVIIIMENKFGLNKNYFSNYFKSLTDKSIDTEDHEQIRNLLYVACSRAKKNLRVLYLDEISEFKDGIETIFTDINHFK